MASRIPGFPLISVREEVAQGPMTAMQPSAAFRTRVIGSALALFVGLGVCYLALARSGAVSVKQWDFLIYYAGSRLVVLGHGGSLYSSAQIGRLEAVLAAPFAVPGGSLPYLFAPYLAVALAPLALLPYTVAYGAWMGVNCVLLALSSESLQQYAGLGDRASRLFRAAAFISLPVLVALLLGQTSVLLLTCFTAAFFALRSNRDLLAGACLALTLGKPQYVFPVLLVLVLCRRWRALAAFGVAAAVLAVAVVPILGLRIDLQYFSLLQQAAGGGHGINGFQPILNRSLHGWAELLFPASLVWPVTAVLDVAALLLLVRATMASRTLDIPYALAIVVALLISPHVLIHDLTLLLIPVAAALAARETGPRYLKLTLAFLYLSVLVGFALPLVVPVQLSVAGMGALAFWLFAASLHPEAQARANTKSAEDSSDREDLALTGRLA